MSEGPFVPRAPDAEEVVLEIERKFSRLRVLFSEWEDGHNGCTVAFLGLKVEFPRWRHVHLQAGEVRRVARGAAHRRRQGEMVSALVVPRFVACPRSAPGEVDFHEAATSSSPRRATAPTSRPFAAGGV